MSKKDLSENIDMDMMNNNKVESYRIMKNQKVKANQKGNKKCLIDYEENKDDNESALAVRKTRKRSNSINLYKKKRKAKESIKKRVNRKDLEDDIENQNKIAKKSSKNLRNKKVSFLKPNFVTIIDVESYKKYNEENTCKDPFEDMEFINNINLDHINKNISKNNEDEEDGKERVQCTSYIL